MTIDRTEPEFSSRISKSSGVLSEVAIETNTAVFTSLKHLQYTQKKPAVDKRARNYSVANHSLRRPPTNPCPRSRGARSWKSPNWQWV